MARISIGRRTAGPKGSRGDAWASTSKCGWWEGTASSGGTWRERWYTPRVSLGAKKHDSNSLKKVDQTRAIVSGILHKTGPANVGSVPFGVLDVLYGRFE